MTTGPTADERSRIRDYLLAQGQKYTWLELWPRVTGARLDFLDAIKDVTTEQAAFQPNPDDWSIAEITHHFLQTSRGVARSVELLANGQAPGSTDHEPPRATPTLAWTDLQTALAEDSVALAALVTGLPEPPSFEQTSDHMFFGPLHGRAWYLFQRVHDVDHTNQVLANKEAPGYPAS
jgi:hypothetical protein